MRIKGGGHYPVRHFIEEKAGVFREKGEIIEPEELDLKQEIIVRALDGKTISPIMFAILAKNPLAAVGFLAGVAPSIGEELGAIGGVKGYWNKDKRDSWFGSGLIMPENQRTWGFASGFLRGLFLGGCLALTTLNPWFILAGASFPVVYFIGVSIEQVIQNKVSVSWYIGELLYGAALGLPLII